jgi:hypothetical protein
LPTLSPRRDRYNRTVSGDPQLSSVQPGKRLEASSYCRSHQKPRQPKNLWEASPTSIPLTPSIVSTTSALLALLLAAAGFATLCRVRRTTLAAPALWWIVAALTIAAVEAALAFRLIEPSTLAASRWRYAAAVGTFCPLVAVLGAKRPQDRGWQWVVAALWLTLLVPVAQSIVSPGGTRLELFAAWRWLLWAFIAMSLLNYLPTRMALAALLAAAGQSMLLRDASSAEATANQDQDIAIGLALLTAAWLAAELTHARRRSRTLLRPASQFPADSVLPLATVQTARWLAFRDAWGAFWAVRILQRVNHTAELANWPIRLQWNGVVSTNDRNDAPLPPLAPDTEASLNQSLDALLRRFERVV